ncbi:methyl-accepting chemotaxis protein [Denitrificimonas caeni]|uniref:Methyl-accepting chemotaxis protein n=1 Tax=Denitrificimonas caeni TaxID=521720 RepID=A0AAE9VRU4_9GAMM|nr:methyl-accepting chemotaxis protein [Denitrificimonas caeni]WBE26253.1 methyl-accepting chemotaxis protein [Denitrificimonas caeni]
MKNIKVSVKLAISIGAILLLIIILAANGLYNINHILMRGDNTLQLTQIDLASKDLLIASSRYNASADEKYIQQTQALIADIQKNITNVRPKLTEQHGIEAINQIATNVENYSKAFADNVQAQQKQASNLDSAVSSGLQTIALLNELNELVNGSAQQPILHEDFYDTVTGRLAADLAQARYILAYTARVFLMEESAQSLQRLEDRFTELQAISQQLRPRLHGQAASLLADSSVALESYMSVLRQTYELDQAQLAAAAVVDNVYANMRRNIDQILEIQTVFRAKVASSAKFTSITLTLIAIVLGSLIGILIVRQITRPLNQAISIAQAIGNSDMTGTSVEQRKDEFGTLLKALNQTRNNLSGALGEVNGITTQLAAAAEELSVVTNQTSAGVHNQRIETEQVATAMNEMSATVHEVAQNAEEAATAAQKADHQAKTGNQALQVVLSDINTLSQDVHTSAEAIQRLNQDSTSIGTVLTVINSIAEQTNLLALNAAIEAARAGEAGRGFAVVADEVRNLAHRTQQSIAQIEELIANLQQGSQNAVATMDSSRTLASLTLEHAQEAGEELTAITRTVSEIQAMNIQIATAAEEQSAVAEEINVNVDNVNNIADQSAAAVEETSASAAELARLSQSLQSLVARFKI